MDAVTGLQEHGWLTIKRLMTEIAAASARLPGFDHGGGGGVEGGQMSEIEVGIGGHARNLLGGSTGLQDYS